MSAHPSVLLLLGPTPWEGPLVAGLAHPGIDLRHIDAEICSKLPTTLRGRPKSRRVHRGWRCPGIRTQCVLFQTRWRKS